MDSACSNCVARWFCGTLNSDNEGVSDFSAYCWDPFPPPGVPRPALLFSEGKQGRTWGKEVNKQTNKQTRNAQDTVPNYLTLKEPSEPMSEETVAWHQYQRRELGKTKHNSNSANRAGSENTTL